MASISKVWRVKVFYSELSHLAEPIKGRYLRVLLPFVLLTLVTVDDDPLCFATPAATISHDASHLSRFASRR